jgi:hypothetical protein
MSQADLGPPALAQLQVGVTVHHAVPVRHHPADVLGGPGTSPSLGYRWVSLTIMQFLSGIILQMSQADMGAPALARLQVGVTDHHAVPVRHHPADVPGGPGTSRPRTATGGCHCPSCSSCLASSCRCPRRTWDHPPSPGYRWVLVTIMQFLSGVILQMSQAPGGHGTTRPRPATGSCHCPSCSSCPASTCRCPRRTRDHPPWPGYR